MADMYIQIDGLKGESTDSEHKDWIELLSFSHSITQPATATSSAGGGSTTHCQHQDYSVTKHVDISSPKLYEACSSGKHFKSVTIEMMRPSDKRVKFMEVKLEEVIVSHVAPGGGTDFPTETVSFNYGRIKWTYTQQRADGSQGGKTTGGWDLVKNKVA